MDHTLQTALAWRYATKKFDTTKKVDEAKITQILEAARLAPSSTGVQPWKFIVVKNPEVRAKLRAAGYGQPQITDASHLIVFAVRTDLGADYAAHLVESTAKTRGVTVQALAGYRELVDGTFAGHANDLEAWAAKQLYIALGFALYTAALLQVDACPMEGFDAAKFDEILGLKAQSCKTHAIMAVGYRAADDVTATYKKARFSMSEVMVEV